MPTVRHANILSRRLDLPVWLSACGYKKLCEVGVREGNHLKSWVQANPTELIGVDLWANDGVLSHNDKQFPQARLDQMFNDLCMWGALLKPANMVKLLRGDSVKMAEAVADASLDFVYIDADHTYEAVKADIAAWWPKVKVGGTIGGHDYVKRTLPNGVSFGVIQAVSEFAARLGLKEAVHTTAGTIPEVSAGLKDYYASWFITRTLEMPAK